MPLPLYYDSLDTAPDKMMSCCGGTPSRRISDVKMPSKKLLPRISTGCISKAVSSRLLQRNTAPTA